MQDIISIFRDKIGRWRPVNPFPYVSEGAEYLKHHNFEQSIIYHEFPNAPDTKEGEVVMAYLQWQMKLNDVWYNSVEPTAYNKEYYRQIWCIKEPKQKAEEDIYFELKGQDGNGSLGIYRYGSDRTIEINWTNSDFVWPSKEQIKQLIEALEKITYDDQEAKEEQPKEETIEQAATRIRLERDKSGEAYNFWAVNGMSFRKNGDTSVAFKDGFIQGADWQKQQPTIQPGEVSAEDFYMQNWGIYSIITPKIVIKAMHEYATLKTTSVYNLIKKLDGDLVMKSVEVADKQKELDDLKEFIMYIRESINNAGSCKPGWLIREIDEKIGK